MADQIVSARMESAKAESARSAEEDAKAMASMRLAYQDMSVQQKREEEKMKKVDPQKAKQMERLGMGFGGFNSGGNSHSLVSDIHEIVQEEPTNAAATSSFTSSTKDKFFDDFEVVDAEKDDLPPWRTSRVDDICSAPSFASQNNKSAWENDLNENLSKPKPSSNWDRDFDDKPKRKPAPSSYASNSSGGSAEDAVKKFGNAKSISSDMYFGNNDNGDRDANLTRFQGSSSISSDMYFNRDTGSSAGGMSRSSSAYSNIQAPDMDDVKESVRQGVSKVAGRLSSVASGVMNQLQRVKNGTA